MRMAVPQCPVPRPIALSLPMDVAVPQYRFPISPSRVEVHRGVEGAGWGGGQSGVTTVTNHHQEVRCF